jgi:hypothetical protein
MRQTILIILTLHSIFTFGQSSRSELSNSRIYVRATYFDKKNEYIGLQTRKELTDTLISNIKYKKIQTSDFTDYSEKRELKTVYESFSNETYCLLDNNKQTIHRFSYSDNKEQTGIIFGKEKQITLEFLDTRSSFSRDSLIPSNKTPRKYFSKDNPEIYVVIIPDLKTNAVSSNGQFYTKQLFGDNYNDISNGYLNDYKESTRYSLKIGDEIQLFYRRKWYNDTTNIAEYEDKQFKNFKYKGDTLINKEKAHKFEVEGYNYLSGSYDSTEEIYVTVKDSGYTVGYQFIPFKEFKTELKLVNTEKGKDIFLQGVTFDTIEGNTYPKIVQAKSDPYRYFILPFFPMPFIEFGNVQGKITYSKINGVEKGKKRQRTFIEDKTIIRDIVSRKKNEVEIEMYFTEVSEVEIEIQDFETNKVIAKTKTKSKIGINTIKIPSKKYLKGKEYRVQISYTNKDKSSGSFSNSVKIKN